MATREAVISVVLGTWNRLEMLKSCLEHIRFSVGDLPIEIIVVDGGSTDGTLDWLRAQDVTTVEQGELLGACRAFNAGFRLAKAPYVVHINDDDEVQGDSIARAYRYMQEHPDVGQVAFMFDLWRPGHFQFDVVFGRTYANKGMTRRELGDRAQWWTELFHTYGGDCELSCRIMEMGYKVVGLQDCQVHDRNPRDELYQVNNPGDVNPDSKHFYAYRKEIEEPTGFNRRVLHVALNVPGDNQPALERALRSMGEYRQIDWKKLSKVQLRSQLLKTCEEWSPDLVFMQLQTGRVVDPETAKHMRDCATVVNWSGDVRGRIEPWYFELGKVIDWTLVTNMNWVEQFRKKGVRADFLQIGFNQEVFHPWGPKRECEPIVFMGNHYGSFPLSGMRVKMVDFLRKTYGDSFGLYGRGWRWRTERLNHQEEAAHYRGCKIAVGISQFDLKRYTSDRLFRAMGSGPLYLTKWYPDIELDFQRGVHLDWWKNLKELREKVDYYLAHEGEGQRIARAGSRLVHTGHTWLDRTAELARIIGWHPWR